MNAKELAQKCIDIFGETTQREQMVEEGSELTTALCHYMHRRPLVHDNVCEEIADCYACLDAMDILFSTEGICFEMSDEVDIIIRSVISDIGEMQMILLDYDAEDIPILKPLFQDLRNGLNELSDMLGKKEIEAWRKIKHDRMVDIIKRAKATR